MRDALQFARSGDTLVVWKLDRLARSMKQLIETIEELRLKGIGFRSLTEALDTTTAQGRLVFHMFGALAEFERSLIRERTQAGLSAARRVGRTGGRPPKLTNDDIEAAKANWLDRYTLSARNALKHNADGSVDLYIQATSPGTAREANWLPTPQSGKFIPMLRLYWPKETPPSILDGTWKPPGIQRVS